MHSVSGFVIQPNPASIGEVFSLISLPYKQYPISILSVSLAAKPTGIKVSFLFDLKRVSQISTTSLLGIYISSPPEPVYPVLDKIISLQFANFDIECEKFFILFNSTSVKF